MNQPVRMNKEECKDVVRNYINEPQRLVADFRSDDELTVKKAFHSLYVVLFEEFAALAHKTVLWNKSFPPEIKGSLLNDGFNDGLQRFYFSIRQNGFEKGSATLKTYFLHFCINKLRGLVTVYLGRSKKEYKGDPDLVIQQESQRLADTSFMNEEEEQKKKKTDMVKEALKILGERCARLLSWQKLDKLEKEEIARRLAIKPGNINNEVYRCAERFKVIYNQLKKG